MARWGLRERTSNRQHAKRGGITNGDADSADACTGSCTGAPRGKGKEREGRERQSTRGDILHEWIKERDWCGLMLQKVRIILGRKKYPHGQSEQTVLLFLFVAPAHRWTSAASPVVRQSRLSKWKGEGGSNSYEC